jgi:hypothetical protein
VAGDGSGYNQAVRLLGLLALSACGRIDFDARHVPGDSAVDAPADMMLSTSHDEDGDGIPDADDPCPHVAGDATDTDGDGVGDNCDINPTAANEHWVLFSTMQPGDTAFDSLTGLGQEADSVRSASDSAPALTMTLASVRIDMGWDVHGVVGTGQHQIALGVDQDVAPTPYYFGELNDNGMGFHDAALVSYDSTNGYQQLDQQDPGVFHAGSGLTRLDTGPTHRLRTGWTGQMYELTAATAAYAGGDYIRFAFNGLDVSIRYLAIIASN